MYLPEFQPLLLSAELSTDLVKLCRKRSRAQQSQATTSDDATITTIATKKRRVVKKSVGFAAAVEIATTMPTASVSSPDTWYVANQYTAFKSNMKRDVIYFASLCAQNKCEEMDRTEYSPLGLEKYCCSAADQLRSKQTKQQRIHAVLQMQAMQKVMFNGRVIDKEAIRTLATSLAQPVCERASIRADRLHHALLLD